METVRNKLRDIKSSIVGTIEEKKLINAQIEAIRNAKRAMEDQVKAARASVSSPTAREIHCANNGSLCRGPLPDSMSPSSLLIVISLRCSC